MSINATNKPSEGFDPIEAGSYPARVYQMIEIGNIEGQYGTQNKVRIGFELPTEMMVFKEENGKQPRVISNDYTLSFNEKANLRKVIDACDPSAIKIGDDGFLEEFDVEQLVGKVCLITIVHKPSKDGSKVYANIGSVTTMPKGMDCPEAINKPMVLSYDKWDEKLYDSLPNFIKEKIQSSQEYQSRIVRGEDGKTINETEDSPFNNEWA